MQPPALAHDYWFEPDGHGHRFVRGHRFSEHSGEREVPYDPKSIVEIVCIELDTDSAGVGADADGPDARAVVRKPEPGSEYPVRVDGPCVGLYVRADTGFWSQTLTGTSNEAPSQRFGVLRSWHAIESAKLLTAWIEQLARPLADGLEIVSETDPFALDTGRKLRLLVTQGGKPREGVTVAYDGDPRGVTGRDGRINIRIRHRGPQRITASIDEPLEDAEVDKRVRSTALFFDLAEQD